MQYAKDRYLRSTFKLLLGACLVLTNMLAVASVTVENTIKKVHTFVNADGVVERQLIAAENVVPGDELQYTVLFSNEGEVSVDAGTIVITDNIPQHTNYIEGSAFGSGTQIQFSVDGETFASSEELFIQQQGQRVLAGAKDYRAIRWNFNPSLEPGERGHVTFKVRLK